MTFTFTPATGVLSVAFVTSITPINMNFSLSGSVLTVSWPADHLLWLLQTNSVNVADPNSWHTLAGSGSGTSANIPIQANQTNVFLRMVYP